MASRDWENMCYKYVEMHKAVIFKKLGIVAVSKNANENQEAYNDPCGERQIQIRASVEQVLWEAHMKSPAAARWKKPRRARKMELDGLSPPPQIGPKRERRLLVLTFQCRLS